MYIKLRSNGDMIVSPCLQLVRRDFLLEHGIFFPELPLMEDNLYLFRCILAAERVRCIPDRFYRRRVRASSTMTSARNQEKQYALGVTFCEIITEAHKYSHRQELYDTILNHALGIIRQLDNVNAQSWQEDISGICRDCVPLKETLLLLLRLDNKYLLNSQDMKIKLQKAWEEKSEINQKLQHTYQEKSDRGVRIKELEEQSKEREEQYRKLRQKYTAQKKETARLNKKLERKEAKLCEIKTKLQETKAKQQEMKTKLQATRARLAQANNNLDELNARFLVRISQKLRSMHKKKVS